MNGPGDHFLGYLSLVFALMGLWFGQVAKVVGRICVLIGGLIAVGMALLGLGMIVAGLVVRYIFPPPAGLVSEVDMAYWLLKRASGCFLIYYLIGCGVAMNVAAIAISIIRGFRRCLRIATGR